MVPTTSNLVVVHCFDNNDGYFHVNAKEKIILVDFQEKYIGVKIETPTKLKYNLLMDCTIQPFSITPFLENVENTRFDALKKDVKQ